MSGNKRPFLQRDYVFFPMGGSTTVVDFWSSFFILETDGDADALSGLQDLVVKQLHQLGYAGDTDGRVSIPSFSGGLIGITRPMLVIHNRRASAMLYFKHISDYGYLSLRVAYHQHISWLKILRFALVVFGIMVVLLGIRANIIYPQAVYFSNQSFEAYTIEHITDFYVQTPRVAAWTTGIVALLVMLVWGGFSWWRSGKFLGFLRENFQEIYRDDMASVGQAAYHAIVTAADALSLKAVVPANGVATPPEFGTGATLSAFSRRPRRI